MLLALLMGVRDEPLGVLFLLTASPVAAASFVMVVAARGDGVLAANIVVLTTLLVDGNGDPGVFPVIDVLAGGTTGLITSRPGCRVLATENGARHQFAHDFRGAAIDALDAGIRVEA